MTTSPSIPTLTKSRGQGSPGQPTSGATPLRDTKDTGISLQSAMLRALAGRDLAAVPIARLKEALAILTHAQAVDAQELQSPSCPVPMETISIPILGRVPVRTLLHLLSRIRIEYSQRQAKRAEIADQRKLDQPTRIAYGPARPTMRGAESWRASRARHTLLSGVEYHNPYEARGSIKPTLLDTISDCRERNHIDYKLEDRAVLSAIAADRGSVLIGRKVKRSKSSKTKRGKRGGKKHKISTR